MNERFSSNENNSQEVSLETAVEVKKLIDAETIRQLETARTNELESRLEQNEIEEPVLEEGVVKKIVSSLLAKGKKISQIAFFLTSIGLNIANDNIDTGTLDLVKDKVALKQQEPVKELTEQDRLKIIEQTGFDIYSMADRANFKVEIQVPNVNNEYIIHIGQKHHTEGVEKKADKVRGVIRIQKDIEKVLSDFANQGENSIFNEGYTIETSREYPDDCYKSLKSLLKKIRPSRDCFERLSEGYESDVKYYPKDSSILDSLITKSKYLFRQRAFSLKEELVLSGDFDIETEKAFNNCIQTLQAENDLVEFGDDSIYLYGAVEKLELDEFIKKLPAETREGNKNAFKYDDEMERVSQSYLKADFSVLSLEEIKKVEEEYFKVKKDADTAILDDREDIAIELIRSHNDIQNNIHIVVYGSAHDFTNNILKYNSNNPESPFGLIKLVPRD